MKTLAFASLLALAAATGACAHASSDSTPAAPRGPDFVGGRPENSSVDPSLVASDGKKPIDPVDMVEFKLASADLGDAATVQIQRSVAYLAKHADTRIVLEGHTDRSGTFAYNQDLATRRADAVRASLLAAGVNADRVVMVIFGEEQADPGVNSYDRRVVMFTSPKSTPAVVAEELAKTRALSVAWSDHGHLTVQAGPSVDVSKR